MTALDTQKRFKKIIDWPLFIAVIGLVSIGMFMIFSTSPTIGLTSYQDSYFFIKRHIIFLLIGILALGVGLKLPITVYQKWTSQGFFISLILLALTLVPGLGVSIAGAQRWLNIGIQFQPIEVVKFWVIAYLGVFVTNKGASLKDFKTGFLPALVILAIPVAILSQQPDLGNTLLISSVFILLLFLNQASLTQLATLVGSGIALVTLSLIINPYQLKRIKAFLYPWDDPLGNSYHIIQSFIAIGSGGIFGQGLGESNLKYFYLPLHYSDFIFSIICEEGGLLIAGLTIVLIATLFKRGMSISRRQSDPFKQVLVSGLTLLLVIQSLINIGCVIGILPVTGIPLTFISFGGTSLIVSLFYVGVILNASKQS